MSSIVKGLEVILGVPQFVEWHFLFRAVPCQPFSDNGNTLSIFFWYRKYSVNLFSDTEIPYQPFSDKGNIQN